MAEISAQSRFKTKGTYEVRDSTCEKCGVRFKSNFWRIWRIRLNKLIKLLRILTFHRIKDHLPRGKLYCPICGGNVGRVKQTGVF